MWKSSWGNFVLFSFVLFSSGSSGEWVVGITKSKQEKAVEYKLMLCAYTYNQYNTDYQKLTEVNRKSLPLGVNPTKTQQRLFILGIGLWLSFHVYRLSFHLLCFWIPSLKAFLLSLGYDSQCDRQHLSALKIYFNFLLFFLGSLLLHSVDFCSGTDQSGTAH